MEDYDWEKSIIPLDDAHEILDAFGISPYSHAYERWRRDDGFRHVDLEDVLNESSLVLGVDWREWLQDAVDTIVRQLQEIGVEASCDLGEEGEQGVIRVLSCSEWIKYVPADNDNFDDVIKAVNRLISSEAQYRKFRSCEGSDGWWYAVLKNSAWNGLESTAGKTVQLLFEKI